MITNPVIKGSASGGTTDLVEWLEQNAEQKIVVTSDTTNVSVDVTDKLDRWCFVFNTQGSDPQLIVACSLLQIIFGWCAEILHPQISTPLIYISYSASLSSQTTVTLSCDINNGAGNSCIYILKTALPFPF